MGKGGDNCYQMAFTCFFPSLKQNKRCHLGETYRAFESFYNNTLRAQNLVLIESNHCTILSMSIPLSFSVCQFVCLSVCPSVSFSPTLSPTLFILFTFFFFLSLAVIKYTSVISLHCATSNSFSFFNFPFLSISFIFLSFFLSFFLLKRFQSIYALVFSIHQHN